MRDAQDADVLASGSPSAPTPRANGSSGAAGAGTTNTAPQTPGTERSGGRPGARALVRALAVAAAVIAVDQLTKWWALNSLSPGPCANPDACVELVAGARLRLVFNSGAAFTTGSGYGPLLAVLAMVMTVVLLAMSARRPDRGGAVLLAMVAGGAVGNLIDRVFRADDGPLSGAVVDFVDLGWWPVFNLADSAIVVGTVVLILLTFVRDRSDDQHRDSPDPAAPVSGGPDTADKTADPGTAADSIPGDPVE